MEIIIIITTLIVLLVVSNSELRKDLKDEKEKIEFYKDWIIVDYGYSFYYAFKEGKDILKSHYKNTLKKDIDKTIEEENYKRLYDKFSKGKSNVEIKRVVV